MQKCRVLSVFVAFADKSRQKPTVYEQPHLKMQSTPLRRPADSVAHPSAAKLGNFRFLTAETQRPGEDKRREKSAFERGSVPALGLTQLSHVGLSNRVCDALRRFSSPKSSPQNESGCGSGQLAFAVADARGRLGWQPKLQFFLGSVAAAARMGEGNPVVNTHFRNFSRPVESRGILARLPWDHQGSPLLIDYYLLLQHHS
jgi:hypothetical protein